MEQRIFGSGIPLQSFAVSILLTASLFAAFVWHGFRMQREFESLIRVEFEASRAAADLRYFDEARTVAVFMAAHTADPAWLDRYRDFAGQIDGALERAGASAPTALVGAMIAETEDARGFHLGGQGLNNEAWRRNARRRLFLGPNTCISS